MYFRHALRAAKSVPNFILILNQSLSLSPDVGEQEEASQLHVTTNVLKQAELLKVAPFVFPSIERVKVLQFSIV